jgi:hypothetical protein
VTRLQWIRCVLLDYVASLKHGISFYRQRQSAATQIEATDLPAKYNFTDGGTVDMARFTAAVVLSVLAGCVLPGALAAQAPDQAPAAAPTQARAQAGQTPAPAGDAKQDNATVPLPPLPPTPPGKSTIMGGEIRKIDPVGDVLTLKVYGQKPVKILFDERTQLFLDGKKVPLHDLKPADHASVQTILDGTKVFALSVHVLSKSPEGDYQGRVLSFNPASNELTISSILSHQPMKLIVPANTPVVREGQPSFTAGQQGMSDLVKGSLISATFEADKSGRGVATKISVLATPGAEFVFIGNIAALDTHAGTLALVDPRDDKTYSISFNPGNLPESQKLKMGQHITVTTNFDGTNYVAKSIAVE